MGRTARLALLLALTPSPASAARPDAALVATATISDVWIDAVLAGRDGLPALADVQDAAVEASRGARSTDWAARARWRGLLPEVSVTVGHDADLALRDSATSEGARLQSEAQAVGIRATTRWSLGDLVFADAELRAHREQTLNLGEERVVRERVTDLYFKRLEVQLALCLEPTLERQLLARRLDGLLVALAGAAARRPRKELTCPPLDPPSAPAPTRPPPGLAPRSSTTAAALGPSSPQMTSLAPPMTTLAPSPRPPGTPTPPEVRVGGREAPAPAPPTSPRRRAPRAARGR